MFAKNSKEVACAKAIQSMVYYLNEISTNPNMTLDHAMKTLQWVQKEIPKVNKLLIAIKTEAISKK